MPTKPREGARPCRRWAPDEKELARELIRIDGPIIAARKLGRTPCALKNEIPEANYMRPRAKRRPWSESEIREIYEALVTGERIDSVWQRLPYRSLASVEATASRMRSLGHYLTPSQRVRLDRTLPFRR